MQWMSSRIKLRANMRTSKNKHLQHSETERGSVLLIFAMLIFSILVIAALALDISQRAVTEKEAASYAKFAALAALQKYSSLPKTDSEGDRIDQALDKAKQVGTLNLILNAGGTGKANEMSFEESATTPRLIAGKFYAAKPDDKPSCSSPCESGQPPCFVPLDKVKSACDTTPGANAFRVRGTYLSNVRTILAQVFTSGSYGADVDEIAAFTPRHGVMLVDVSNSMFSQTHLKRSLNDRDFFSYYLPFDNGSTCPIVGTPNYYCDSWSKLAAARGADESKTVHYRNDYTKVTPLSDVEYAAAGPASDLQKYHPDPYENEGADIGVNIDYRAASRITGSYRVDYKIDKSLGGAQPFMTILNGLDLAVEAFKERSITGDKLGIVFFDRAVTWGRVIKPTSNFDYIQSFTKAHTGDDAAVEKLAKHGIFPSNNGSFSNLRLAIAVGMDQLEKVRSSSVPAVDFLAYFGDGIVNCVNNVPNPRLGPAGAGCANTYERYKDAISELNLYLSGTLYPKRIPLHIILASDSVRPHTLLWDAGDGTCLTDEQARKAEPPIPFVVGNDNAKTEKEYFDGMNSTAPFLQANVDMYKLTRMTGGIWGPLRVAPPSGCPYTAPACDVAYNDNIGSAVRDDYTCEPPISAVNGYIDDIMGSNPFMIVPHD